MKEGSLPSITTKKDLTRCSLMVKFVVWDHVSEVRFFPPRPIWADGIIGNTPALHAGVRGSIPRWSTKVMESNAAALVRRPALKTGFSEMGWGSTPLLSAKIWADGITGNTVSLQGTVRDSISSVSTIYAL